MAAIVVERLGKRYHLYHPERPRTFHEVLLRGFSRLGPAHTFWALRDVNFRIGAGRVVGVVGRNGAGKSTLLRLLAGVGKPDEGSVRVRGRIAALLRLGTGFQPDLTGRENVFINGVIHGLTRREVRARFDSIVSFAELETFIDNPLRIYSDGMRMRLAFSVAAHLEPQILLIDEALAVGDASFQRKCLERIGQFKAQGCTIVLVSHDTHRIQQLCDDVLWLRGGRLQTHGPADASLHQYLAESRGDVAAHGRTTVTDQALRHPQPATLRMGENRFGNLEVEITRVRLLDARRQPITDLQNGEALQIEIGYRARHPALAPIFQIYISREDGLPCYDINSQAEAISTDGAARHRRIVLTIHRLDANRGLYYVDVGAYAPNWAYPYDYHSRVYPLLVHSNDSSTAVMSTGFRWDISRAAARPE